MFLTDIFVEGARAHSGGQRRFFCQTLSVSLIKQCHKVLCYFLSKSLITHTNLPDQRYTHYITTNRQPLPKFREAPCLM